ncbi:leucine zipper protein 2 isoform X1 [Cervus canadensis]|uniref:leucine zipper protein 2 isoform X1 n=2 Tax=Cervus canadensis TaxID=1574408 RepID=UPI001CA30C7F|nr:leucine zipper protein 2 isoform X1 [Cervus canadensis]
MKFSPAHYLLPLLPALVLGTRQDYEELEKQLKQVFKERSTILRQLTKTSRELDGIKTNLQNLKNDEISAKTDVQKLLEIGQKQREQMKALQEALENQLKETADKAEKQEATIHFLKTEMERKSKMIRDLQNENKSLKHKLLFGNKLCGLRAEESKKVQSQLKELRYGKKDLLFKAQQLTDLEQKLAVAKNELEKAALDRESQLKAMKETVQLCLSTVFRDQQLPHLNPFRPYGTQISVPTMITDSRTAYISTTAKPQDITTEVSETQQIETTKEEVLLRTPECDTQILLQESTVCSTKQDENLPNNDTAESSPVPQDESVPPCTECDEEKKPENQMNDSEGTANREKKLL